MMVKNHFVKNHIDLAGENYLSHCDGICPNGKVYEVKSSKLYMNRYWMFHARNKYKHNIDIYYFLAFNEDYTKVKYVWRVPGEIAEKDSLYVGLNNHYEFNVENMKEFDITDKLLEVIKSMGL